MECRDTWHAHEVAVEHLVYKVVTQVVRVHFNVVNTRLQPSRPELIVAHLVRNDNRATGELVPAIGAPRH